MTNSTTQLYVKTRNRATKQEKHSLYFNRSLPLSNFKPVVTSISPFATEAVDEVSVGLTFDKENEANNIMLPTCF